jgi:murein DD-endopeptidase MepM/ murein hydrolase activator NlpD
MLVLALFHLLTWAIVQARPGPIGALLWLVGPPVLAVLAAALLLVALVGAFRGQTITGRRAAAFIGLVAVAVAVPGYRTYPSSHDAVPSAVPFRLPLEGPVTVAWGGPTRRVNHHVAAPGERWAYDLLVTGPDGRSHRGDGRRLSDYHAYDLPVLSLADGLVRAVRDGEPDTVFASSWRGSSAAGNHVVLEVAPDQFLVVAHLRAGSVTVALGTRVRRGDPLGRVGNSGKSSEPHVHVHLQDRLDGLSAEGIPLLFHDYRQAGRRIRRGMPEGGRHDGRWIGHHVEQLPPSPPRVESLDRARHAPAAIARVRHRHDRLESARHDPRARQPVLDSALGAADGSDRPREQHQHRQSRFGEPGEAQGHPLDHDGHDDWCPSDRRPSEYADARRRPPVGRHELETHGAH